MQLSVETFVENKLLICEIIYRLKLDICGSYLVTSSLQTFNTLFLCDLGGAISHLILQYFVTLECFAIMTLLKLEISQVSVVLFLFEFNCINVEYNCVIRTFLGTCRVLGGSLSVAEQCQQRVFTAQRLN